MTMRALPKQAVRVFWLCFALVGGGIGIYFAYFFKGGSPYSFRETLPQMVSSFGADARVVQIQVSSDNVDYQVITRNSQLRDRAYILRLSRVQGGGTGNTREVENSARAPTAREQREARVTLSQLAPGVVESMYREVNFPSQGSSATLSGETWLLQSGARPFDRYEARYDGTDLHQTQSKASVFAPKPSAVATPPRPAVTTSGVTTLSVTVTSAGRS